MVFSKPYDLNEHNLQRNSVIFAVPLNFYFRGGGQPAIEPTFLSRNHFLQYSIFVVSLYYSFFVMENRTDKSKNCLLHFFLYFQAQISFEAHILYKK